MTEQAAASFSFAIGNSSGSRYSPPQHASDYQPRRRYPLSALASNNSDTAGRNKPKNKKKRDNSLVFLFSHLAALLSHFFFFFEFVRFQRIGLRRRRLDDRWRPLPKRRTTTSNFISENESSSVRDTFNVSVDGYRLVSK